MCKYLILASVLFISCRSANTFYIVRHAEKESAVTMSTDVPLSATGRERAEALRELLQNESITAVYSTGYSRTISTVKPLADARGLSVLIYNPLDTTFFTTLRNTRKGKVLVAGHSNTVDDIVNSFFPGAAVLSDLPEHQYGDLFVIKRKGNRYTLERRRFGP